MGKEKDTRNDKRVGQAEKNERRTNKDSLGKVWINGGWRYWNDIGKENKNVIMEKIDGMKTVVKRKENPV